MGEILKWIFALLLLTSGSSFAQGLSKKDTVLYLYIQSENHYKGENSRDIDPSTKEWIPVVRYSLRDSHFYDGYPLRFISERKDLIDTVSLNSLKRYPIVSFKELEQFISENYKKKYPVGYQGREYFLGLKHIYLVEKNEEKGTATITEVELDLTIE